MAKDQPPRPKEKELSPAERHHQGLKAVNEKLAELVASLRDQKQHFSEHPRRAAPPADGGKGAARMDSSPTETTLAAELALARAALEQREAEDRKLRDRLADIEAENRRVCDEFVAVQEQNAELVSLYAAVERLHAAPDRSEVLAAIQEIVVNVVGSEELALFELTPDGNRLAPTHAFGVDTDTLGEIAMGSGAVGRAAAEGRSWIAGERAAPASPAEPHVTACVPLKVGDRVTGALVIYSLLGHKPALTSFDRELFALLERHAALALHFRALDRRTGAR
jgi:hypothetical protein